MRTGGAARRRDSTEAEIIAAIRAVGGFVRQLHGDGAPDLIVKLKGLWLPLEVKSPTGKVRPSQSGYPIVRTPAEALALWGIRLLEEPNPTQRYCELCDIWLPASQTECWACGMPTVKAAR